MVFLTSDSNSENAKPRNSLILQKLKQARAEHEAQKDETLPHDTPNASKKFVHKKSSKLEIASSSSSSSSSRDKFQLIRRSTVQEQLFAVQCQRSRQNFSKYRSMRSSESKSSTNTVNEMQKPRVQGNSKYQFKKYKGKNNNNDDDDDDDENDNAYKGNCKNNESDDGSKIGVLHLKKPLKLTDSDDFNYFNGSNRMKPIDWSLVNGETNDKNKNTCKNKKNIKNISPSKKIDQSSNILPIGDTDFTNFVNNSTSNDTVYRVHNKLKESIRSDTESPILKIQKAIKHCKADAITVTQEIKEAFVPTQQEPRIIDLIDRVDINSPSYENSPSQTSRLHTFKNNVHSLMQKIQKRNIEEFKRSQLQEVKENSTNILNNSSKMAERKKMIDEYNDDMMDFVKPNLPSKSPSLESCENSDRKFYTDENSEPAYISRKLIDKFKNSRMLKVHNTSLDSDDVSTERSSELDDLSATRRSTSSKYETLKMRLVSASTQTSPKKKSIDKVNRNLILLKNTEKIEMDKCEEKPLMKECFTRYFKKPSTIIVDKTVPTEIEEDIPEEEPLLKPVSTRYFSTLTKEENTSSDRKSKLIIEENTIQTTENDSVTNNLNIFNKESTTKDNSEVKEIISDSKKIEEIVSGFKETREIILDSKETEEIISNSKEIVEIDEISASKDIEEIEETSESEEIEEITSGSRKIENFRNICFTSSSEEYILNAANNKKENILISDSTTTSSSEDKDSEENSKLSSPGDVKSQSPLKSTEEDNFTGLEEINTKAENNFTGYEDVNSEEEFDVVNCEQFSAFNALLNKLQAVAAAQKEHSLGLQNELNDDINQNDCQSDLKAIESSLDSSNNTYSTVSASVSSNLESDNENSVISSNSSNFLLTNKNVFENIEINVKNLNNYQFNDDETLNATKLNNETKGVNQKTEISARQQKKINALKNYRKSKDTEGGNQVAQENNAVQVQNEILRESKMSNQILNEIKKQKLHLNCKPWLG